MDRYCEVCGGPVCPGKPVHTCGMKLWLLERDDYERDEWAAFVVRAETEQEARSVAASQVHGMAQEHWTDQQRSSCVEVTVEGLPEVILGDFASG